MGGSASPVVLIGAGIVGASALLDLALTLRSGAFVERAGHMRWFLDLPMRGKLVTGFGVVSALAAVMCVTGVLAVGTLQKHTDSVFERHAIGLAYLKEGACQTLAASDAARAAVLRRFDEFLTTDMALPAGFLQSNQPGTITLRISYSPSGREPVFNIEPRLYFLAPAPSEPRARPMADASLASPKPTPPFVAKRSTCGTTTRCHS